MDNRAGAITGVVVVILIGLVLFLVYRNKDILPVPYVPEVTPTSTPQGTPTTTPATTTPTSTPQGGANQNQRTVRLYYYNPTLDRDQYGNVMCTRQGLVAVERTIPRTLTPIQDTLRLLLRGELTANERARGIGTEFPLEGVSLLSASLQNGTLTLTFSDPQNRTSGGSCRAAILWHQISTTAMQFQNVHTVRFLPEELFQP